MTLEIYAEIEREWSSRYKEIGGEIPSRMEFSDLCAKQDAENRRIASTGLQPWLGVLEFAIEWLSYVHVALDEKQSLYAQMPPRYRTTWALTGSAVSFGLSLRALSLSGFDGPARTLLRSYVEALLRCVTILHDDKLAEAYCDAKSDDEVKAFWQNRVSPRKLHKRITEIEKNAGFDEEVIGEMTALRREEYGILSQSAHLSYVAACLTAKAPVLGDLDSYRMAIFGLATENSHRTILYGAMTTWYFSRIAYDLILSPDSCSGSLLAFAKDNEWQRRIVIGRDVLSNITMKYWGTSVNV
jgi:hypothetical protein